MPISQAGALHCCKETSSLRRSRKNLTFVSANNPCLTRVVLEGEAVDGGGLAEHSAFDAVAGEVDYSEAILFQGSQGFAHFEAGGN